MLRLKCLIVHGLCLLFIGFTNVEIMGLKLLGVHDLIIMDFQFEF